jgi:two-component system CheB/CheR fusion protein
MFLSVHGHQVRACYDGTEALEAVRDFRPNTVVLDIGLPGMNGYEVARRLRQEDTEGKLRLIALTGYGQPRDRELAREAGFDRHLTKPVDPETLSQALSARSA